MTNDCKTKYPVFFVHGMGIKDLKFVNIWGRIPKLLKENGAVLYYGNTDANSPSRHNAAILKSEINKALEENNCDKVNIIAHSKGGLDSRYMISSLDMADRVASLTTVSTPHNGSETLDFLLERFKPLIKIGSDIADIYFKILGDSNPETFEIIESFTTKGASLFNEKNPDSEKVYYQSYSFVMKNIFSDIFMAFPYSVVYLFEGDNDGFLPPKATEWTNYKGVVTSGANRGISHLDQHDFRRMNFCKGNSPQSNIALFYKNIVSELKAMGF